MLDEQGGARVALQVPDPAERGRALRLHRVDRDRNTVALDREACGDEVRAARPVERGEHAVVRGSRASQRFVTWQVHGASIVDPMNVVFLSPHFPPAMWLYVRRLREA